MAVVQSLMSALSPQLLVKRLSREVGQLDKRFADCVDASMGADEAKFSNAAQVLSGYRDRLSDIAKTTGDGSRTTSVALLERLRLARVAEDPMIDGPQGEAGIRSALVTAYQARKAILPTAPAGEPVSNFVSQESALDHGTTVVPATNTAFVDAENALNHPTAPLPATNTAFVDAENALNHPTPTLPASNSSFASQEAALNGFTSQADMNEVPHAVVNDALTSQGNNFAHGTTALPVTQVKGGAMRGPGGVW